MTTARTTAPKHSYRQQATYISDIWGNRELFGFERWFMLTLAAVRLALPSLAINAVAQRFDYPGNKVVVDVYCLLKPLILLVILKANLAPTSWSLIVACVLDCGSIRLPVERCVPRSRRSVRTASFHQPLGASCARQLP